MKITIFLLAFTLSFDSLANSIPDFNKTLKRAEQGYAAAKFNLGLMYDSGQGVTQDYKEAHKWYLKAAEQGYAKAQYNLAVMYANGQGIIQSNKSAYIWSSIAAANGSENGSKNRDLFAKELSASTLDEAQREAAELYNKMSNRIK